MTNTPDRVLSSKETAEMLGVSTRTLDRIAVDGGLPKIKLSPGRVGFRHRDVMAWIESRTVRSAA